MFNESQGHMQFYSEGTITPCFFLLAGQCSEDIRTDLFTREHIRQAPYGTLN